ncbi:putative nucleic acid-binding protein [Streptacidiphilus sp. MAP12-20]|uniref:PIN domain-containing protein n=1 Tax=Streptacidiphilus sp. MAP12-20 TaxID=3156299 RepID=UPI0035157623
MSESVPVAIVDSSALVSAFNVNEAEHEVCREALKRIGHAVISPMVLAEVDYLLMTGISEQASQAALRYIADKVAVGRFEVPEVGAHLHAAHAVGQNYISFPLGLTDAMNVVLAREFRTDAIATLDRKHFRAVTPLTGHSAFRLLPDDLELS